MIWCKNQWLGFGAGLWDMSEVRKRFDFLLEEDVVAVYGSLDRHPVLATHAQRGCEINCDSLPERVRQREREGGRGAGRER